MKQISIIIISYFLFFSFLEAKDLSRQEPIQKVILLKGVTGEKHYFQPKNITFDAGNLYQLKIRNVSDSKHYFSSNSFSNAIFTRKIQVNFNNEKAAEIKGTITEIEVWPGQEVEWWFVPIKAGVFKDLFCNVIDKKLGLSHSAMGMNGILTIK